MGRGWLTLVAAVAVALGGCIFDMDGSLVDRQPADAAVDVPASDLSDLLTAEVGPDLPLMEAGPDLAPTEAGPDLPPTEAGPDLASTEVGPDL